MVFSIILRCSKNIVPLLICSILISCSASKHFGKTTVEEPTIEEKDVDAWFRYYQDQFDAKGGKVEKPNEKHSTVALEAYKKAEVDWESKVREKNKQTIKTIVYISGGIILIILIIPKPHFINTNTNVNY